MTKYEIELIDRQESIFDYSNKQFYILLSQEPTKCPICHVNIKANFMYGFVNEAMKNGYIFFECRNCTNAFINQITKLRKETDDCYAFTADSKSTSLPNIPIKENFEECICDISPSFIEIYNQASAAECYGLNEIAGVGYRKAFEFLIKDYLCKNKNAEEQEKIKNKFLGNIIREDINNANLKQIAKRTVWLGNDEVHYLKKWNKDIKVLKMCISISVDHVANDLNTAALLADMSDNKK